MPQNNYSITSQITITSIIIMKRLEMLPELPKCDTDTRSEQMLLEKNGNNRSAGGRVATNVQFIKKNKNKTKPKNPHGTCKRQ